MPNQRELAVQGQEVSLQIQYFDSCGDKVVADETPSIKIMDLDGNTIVDTTTNDVEHFGDGLYEYVFRVPDDGDSGSWIDEWTATIDEAELVTSFDFMVITASTGLSANTGPGKISLADDIVLDFTDEELEGVNLLLKYLKARLRSNGVRPVRDEFGAYVTDGYGEIVTEECNVFDDEILVCLLCQGLSEFNSVPFFTNFSFHDNEVKTLFSHIIVEASYVFALASQGLLEKGRDFTITDGGISYQPPQLGDYIQSMFSTWLTSYRERVKYIKNSIRPGPRSFGTRTSLTSGASPRFRALRHLKSRKIL